MALSFFHHVTLTSSQVGITYYAHAQKIMRKGVAYGVINLPPRDFEIP
jgi:hypothetical protein